MQCKKDWKYLVLQSMSHVLILLSLFMALLYLFLRKN